MADGDVVRRLTISATGENIDRTTESLKQLGDASTKASASNDNFKQRSDAASNSLVNLAAGIFVAKNAYEGLTTASDKASASIGSAVTGVMNGAKSDIAYLADKIASVWQQGSDKLNSYIELNQKAGDLGVEFYQRITKAATDAKRPANDYLDIINNINKALDRKLGTDGLQNGSTFNTLANELKNNGNLKGLDGDISTLNNSITGPEQLKAALKLLDDAFDKGEKLVGLKLADALGGQKLVDDLKNDNFALEQIRQNIEAVQNKDLIQQSDVDHAEQLQKKIDDATKYINSWFTQTKSDWSGLGIQLHELWANALDNTASVLRTLDSILQRLKDIASAKFLPDIPTPWKTISDYFTAGKTPDQIESQYGVTPLDDAGRLREVGIQKLRDAMTRSNVDSSIHGLQRSDDNGSPDNSRPPPGTTKDDTDAVDRAIQALVKHNEALKADAEAVGLDVGAHARLRAEAQMTAAIQANGGEITAEQTAKFKEQIQAAGDNALALEKLKIANDIKRQRDSVFLNAEDVQIANQLKGLYPSITDALQSAEASQIRFNNLLKNMSDLAKSSAATFATDLVNGLRQGESLMSSLGSAARNLSTSLTNKAFTDLFSGNFVQAGVEGIGAIISGIFGDNQAKKDKEAADRKAAADAAAQKAQAGQDRAAQFTLDAQTSSIDTSTIAGQIAVFDLQSNKARADEMKAGGEAIVALEKKLAVDRQNIVDKANQAVIKSYQDFLNSIKTGNLSTLSPEDQLKFAQSQFNADVTGAKNGDATSIANVTKDAQSLLDIAKSFYSSTTGYTTIYQSVSDAITALMQGGALYTATPDAGIYKPPPPVDPNLGKRGAVMPEVTYGADPMIGAASGGLITNGISGVDSVAAKLAGGEYVTRTASVNAATLGALQYINSTGKLPGGDNKEVVRVLTQGFNGQTAVLSDKLDTLVDRIKRLEDTTRQASTQRRVPGSNQRAS